MADPQAESELTPLDLPAFLPHACRQLQAPFGIRVVVETQEEYVSKTDDKSKKSSKPKSAGAPHTSRTHYDSVEDDKDDDATPMATYADPDEIQVTVMVDVLGRTVEIIFNRCREVPRLLFKIIGLCVPFHPCLTKLTVRWSQLEGVVLYELAKLLPASQLTEICLDDSPVPERNYHMILEHERLRRLSLARCGLDDDACAVIASQLQHPLPASRNLLTLSLVSNCISDVGAAALGRMLRTNRTLRHLDLAGNQISDDGAADLLRSLVEFPLTYEELTTKRHRLIEYLKLRGEVYARCLEELTTAAATERAAEELGRGGRRRTVARVVRKSSFTSSGTGPAGSDALAVRAEAMTRELIGAYSDPFGLEGTVSRDGYVHSVGNSALCYLNLAYNNLGYGSAVALVAVLRYQSAWAAGGLVRVSLEGNATPGECAECGAAQGLLERAVAARAARATRRADRMSQPKSRTK